jgi:hypothetical protein
VELLYKSLQEYHDDLGAETSTQAYQLYADQEQERRSKNNQYLYAISSARVTGNMILTFPEPKL